MAADSPSAAPIGRRAGAEERLTRLIARFVGGGYAIYLVLLAPRMHAQSDESAWWWTPFAVTVIFTPAAWMVWASIFRSLPAVRRAALAGAVGYAIAIATWPLAWNGDLLDVEYPPWVVMIPGLPALGLALVAGVTVTVGYVAVLVTVAEWCEDLRLPSNTVPAQTVWAIGFSVIYAVAAAMAVRTARVLDRTRYRTLETAASASAVEAERSERARFDALTHDWVMSTLLSAARTPDDPGLRVQAIGAIERLERLRAGTSSDVGFGRKAVIAHLRSVVSALDPGMSAVFTARITVDGGVMFPAEAVRAIGAATSEAVRNSFRHAGAGAHRAVTIELAPESIVVTVSDDGAGFDPERVPPDRLGIAAGVQRQMATVAGGSATVISAPAQGTTVRLEWSAS